MTLAADKKYSPELVWALGSAAFRINNGYIKDGSEDSTRTANTDLIKQWLTEESYDHLTEEDYAEGARTRSKCKSYMMKLLNETANVFEKTALQTAEIEEFDGSNLYEFTLIGYYPEVLLRSDIENIVKTSKPIPGELEEKVSLDIYVLYTLFSPNYGSCRITARVGEDQIVTFWHKERVEQNCSFKITAKIKKQLETTTQLHEVKFKK